MTLNKPNPRLAILRAQLAAEADAIKLQRFRYKMSNAIGCSCPVPAPDADSLPLPPSYWEDLEHWLKTLAPAKPAAPALAAGCAHEWVRGIDLPIAERFGLWHYRADQWHKPGNVFDAIEIDDDGEYRRAAHGAKLGDRYDESKYATADLTARLASTSSADGAALVGVKLTHSVCIKAYISANGTPAGVGQIVPFPIEKLSEIGRAAFWLPCDKDGFIPHTPTPDSTCPVPDGVKFDVRLRKPSISCPMSAEELLQSDCTCWWRSGLQHDTGPSDFDVIAWRPIADGRK